MLEDTVNRAYNSGVLVVSAAGNSGNVNGTGDNVEFPARFESVIAVSAIGNNNQRAPFSATGPAVEITAPGVDILSTYLGNTYKRENGTSMAAPFVSANLALLKEAYPHLSHVELRRMLQESALDLGTPGRGSLFGYGLIQAPIHALSADEMYRLASTAGTSTLRCFY